MAGGGDEQGSREEFALLYGCMCILVHGTLESFEAQ